MYPATPKAVKTAVAGLKKEVSAIEQNQPRQTFEKTVAVAGFALLNAEYARRLRRIVFLALRFRRQHQCYM